jgi:lipoprotein-anchoring transpeptidase ErfK/SrfK
VGGQQISSSGGRLWRVAILTAAGAIGATSYAEAAVGWSDDYPGYSRPGPMVPQRRQNSRRHQAKKTEAPEKESAKPRGPLVIAISIEKQKLRIYDANGFFAETPISTGMRGHPTPMGVFSVIEKDRYHHSNIYSNAPMPFMQRITWSGVAMHAGVLPGYPASHGCIRMPMAFAVKMWGWTKMGARVVVTPGEITPPESFSHPLLATEKVAPQPVAATEPAVDAAPKSDKATDAGVTIKPAMSETNGQAAATPLREQTHTADASASLPVTKAPVTMSDATPSGGNKSSRETAAETDHAPVVTEQAGDAAIANSDAAIANSDAAIPEVKSEAAVSETAKSAVEPFTAKPGEAASSEDKPVQTEASDTAGQKPVEPTVAQAGGDVAKAEASANESVKADEPKVEAKTDEVKTSASIPDAPKAVEAKLPEAKPVEATSIKSDDKARAAADTATVPDAKKDQTRAPNTEKAVAKPDPATAAAPKRAGQIAVFVSRKDSKLYVRQNFKPLFNIPVTIAPDDRPLGTHVFTAQVDKDDGNLLHWSVVSIPVSTRNSERRDDEERPSRRRKVAAIVAPKVMPTPDSPAEALNRLSIPADAMARIAEALTTGGSIIVSDQGITAGETGEGTDFIVSLR